MTKCNIFINSNASAIKFDLAVKQVNINTGYYLHFLCEVSWKNRGQQNDGYEDSRKSLGTNRDALKSLERVWGPAGML